MARMTLDLRAIDRDLDALAAGLALPPADGARGALPALADLDAALAALAAGVAPAAGSFAPAAGPFAPAAPATEPAAAWSRSASMPAPSRLPPPRERVSSVPRARAPEAEVVAAPSAPAVLVADALAAPASEAPAGVDVGALPVASPLDGASSVDLAAQIADSLAGQAAADALADAASVETDGGEVGSDDAFYAALGASAAVGAASGPASEPPTTERASLPSFEVVFGEVDASAFDEEDRTSLVSFSSLAFFADRGAATAHAASDDDAPPAGEAAASLSAESLFQDAVSASLLVSDPLDFVAGAQPEPAASLDDATAHVSSAADEADSGARVSVPEDLAALLEGELDPNEFGAPPAVAPLAAEATRVEDGDFEMFVEEDELFAVVEDEAPGPAPLPASATSPSVAPPVSDTAALEGQEKKGFFKKIFGK